jgi:hypothetical protein
MKQFALVGFFVALLMVRAEAQLLFNVTADPGASTVTIAAAPGASITIPQTFPNGLFTDSNGFTLINLFVNDYAPGISVGIKSPGLSISNGTDTFLLEGQPSVGEITDPGTGLNNYGINFDLFTANGNTIGLTRGSTITFSGSITFENFSTFTTASFDQSFQTRVYGGLNNAYDGASFLGTYTLTVVPEPSTYAAIAGGLGLAAAVIHRRRQRAKAAQA